MPLVEVAVVPVGTEKPSMAEQVQAACRVAEQRGLRHQVTPTGTVLEGPLDALLECAQEMHAAVLRSGSPRVLTRITIDERADHPPATRR